MHAEAGSLLRADVGIRQDLGARDRVYTVPSTGLSWAGRLQVRSWVDDLARDRGRRDGGRTGQVHAGKRAAHSTPEVAVAGRDAHLAVTEHAQMTTVAGATRRVLHERPGFEEIAR